MAPQTTNAPFLDGGETFGAGATTPLFTNAPFFDSGAGFAPALTLGTPTPGLVVLGNAVELDESFERRFRDEMKGAGSWQISLANDDANMPDFDDIVAFEFDGQVRFSGPVESKKVVTLSAGEDSEKVTSLSGRGRLAVTDKCALPPSRGWDAVPVEVMSSQFWGSVDFDDSGWLRVIRTRRADIPTPFVPRAIPEWWPDKTAWWVAPNHPGVSSVDAPLGTSLYRSDPISLSAGTIAILTGFNNLGAAFFDGANIAEVQNSPNDGNRVDLDVSTGDHILAARVTNYIRDTGFIASIYSVDDDGLLDTLLWSSDSDNMRALGYPTTIPGFTAGKAIRLKLEAVQADDELTDVTLDFDDFLDSSGEPWTVAIEITNDVGRSLMEYLESLSDWLIDVQMAPGSNAIRAWNWGTRGNDAATVTIAATTDPATSEVEGLAFDGIRVRANRLRIRYKHGYTTVDLGGTPVVTAFLDLADVASEDAAQAIGANLLNNRQGPSYAGTLTLAPVSSTPYEDFDNGDYVGHPAAPDAAVESRVLTIGFTEDENAKQTWVLELNDVRAEIEERHDNWLKRIGLGHLAGGARVTSRRGDSIAPPTRVAAKNVAEFSFDGVLPGAPE